MIATCEHTADASELVVVDEIDAVEHCRRPAGAIAALFCRGDLPRVIVCKKAYSAVSGVRVGHAWEWVDADGTYRPLNGCRWHLMAHEVRRNLGTIYAGCDD